MTPIYAILGLALVILAIPLGLMLTPLIIGAILLWLALRRMDASVQLAATGEPA